MQVPGIFIDKIVESQVSDRFSPSVKKLTDIIISPCGDASVSYKESNVNLSRKASLDLKFN